jgi:myosin heavy subunit
MKWGKLRFRILIKFVWFLVKFYRQVYFSNGVLESLETVRGNLIHAHVVVIQASYRGSIVRKDFLRKRRACMKIQVIARKIAGRERFRRLKQAITSLQRSLRVRQAKLKVARLRVGRAVSRIQSYMRMRPVRKTYQRIRKCAIIITAWMKTRILRTHYLVRIAKAREDRDLKKKIELINAQLEDERAARVALELSLMSNLSAEKDLLEKELHVRRQNEMEELRLRNEEDTARRIESEALRRQQEIEELSDKYVRLQNVLESERSRAEQFQLAQLERDNELNALKMQLDASSGAAEDIRARLEFRMDLDKLESERIRQEELTALQVRLESEFQEKLAVEVQRLTEQMQEEIEEENRCVEAQWQEKLDRHKASLEKEYAVKRSEVEVVEVAKGEISSVQGSEKVLHDMQKLEEEVISFTLRENEITKQLKLVILERDKLQEALSSQQSLFLEEMSTSGCEIRSLRESEAKLKARLSDLEIIAEAHACCSEQKSESEGSLLAKISTLECALLEAESEKLKVVRSYTATERQLNEKLVVLAANEKNLLNTVSQQEAALTEGAGYVEQLKSEAQSIRQEYLKALAATDRLIVELTEVKGDGTKGTLLEEISVLQMEKLNLTEEVSRVCDANTHLQGESMALEAKCRGLNETVLALSSEVNLLKLKPASSDYSDDIINLRAELEESQATQRHLRMQNEQYQKRLEDLALVGQRESHGRLEEQNSILISELRSLKDLHDKLTEEISNIKKAEPFGMDGRLKDKRQSDLFTELIELRAKNEILTKEIVSLKKPVSSLPGSLRGHYPPAQSEACRSPTAVSGTTMASNGSQQTSFVNIDVLEREINSLRREKELYVAEKRVLLELLSSQCDEMDSVEASRKETDR